MVFYYVLHGERILIYWVDGSWGVWFSGARWCIMFGDEEQAGVTGVGTRNHKRRHMKKEITHYITKGFCRGPYHGALKKINQPIKAGE